MGADATWAFNTTPEGWVEQRSERLHVLAGTDLRGACFRRAVVLDGGGAPEDNFSQFVRLGVKALSPASARYALSQQVNKEPMLEALVGWLDGEARAKR